MEVNRRSFLTALAGLAAVAVLPFKFIAGKRGPQTYVWRGGDGHWDDPSQWKPHGVPQDGDSIEIHAGTCHALHCPAVIESVTMTGGTLCWGERPSSSWGVWTTEPRLDVMAMTNTRTELIS